MKKQCSQCKKEKALTEFHIDKRTLDSRYSACKICHLVYQRKWRKYNQRKWIEKNKEKWNVYRTNWLKTPAGIQTNARIHFKRRAYLKNVICDFSAKDWQEILKKQDNKCKMCEIQFTKENQPTQDHIYPVSKGGHHTKSNIQALCLHCNIVKGDKIIYK